MRIRPLTMFAIGPTSASASVGDTIRERVDSGGVQATNSSYTA